MNEAAVFGRPRIFNLNLNLPSTGTTHLDEELR